MNINTSLLTILVGILGIFFGTLISPYINHKLTQRYNRKDLFFKKKLEYFERIAECTERNIRTYRNSIRGIGQNRKKIEGILKKIKEERKNFLILSSPLYFETIKLSKLILEFTNIEKRIFADFEELTNKNIGKKIIHDLEKRLEILKKIGNRIIWEMKREIKKEI